MLKGYSISHNRRYRPYVYVCVSECLWLCALVALCAVCVRPAARALAAARCFPRVRVCTSVQSRVAIVKAIYR